jgi:hypothetical protein
MWLYCEIKQVREAFAEQISAAVSELNKATRPSDLGLSAEEFPFKIWRGSTRSRSAVRMDDELTLGEILEHRTRAHSKHSFVTKVESALIEVQPSGKLERMEVNLSAVHRCRGAGVLIPGPLKREQRCRDKIHADYEDREPWPPAASLLDIVRCTVAFDDPYAMAVMLAYLAKEFDVVRVKNRFENDVVEEVSAERLQAEFYAAETLDDDTHSKNDSGTKSDNYYRDVQLNLRPKGSNFICEVQLTLTGISILKKSEQNIYTLTRMASAEELTDTFVFSERHEFSSPDALPAGHETIISALPCDDDAGDFTPLLQVADPPFGSPESPRSPASTGSLRRRRRRASDSPASPASPVSVSGAFKTTPSEGEPLSSTEHWVTVLPGAAQ